MLMSDGNHIADPGDFAQEARQSHPELMRDVESLLSQGLSLTPDKPEYTQVMTGIGRCLVQPESDAVLEAGHANNPTLLIAAGVHRMIVENQVARKQLPQPQFVQYLVKGMPFETEYVIEYRFDADTTTIKDCLITRIESPDRSAFTGSHTPGAGEHLTFPEGSPVRLIDPAQELRASLVSLAIGSAPISRPAFRGIAARGTGVDD